MILNKIEWWRRIRGQLKLVSWGSITDPKFLTITDYCSCCNQQEKMSQYGHECRNSYRSSPRAEK